MFNLVSSREVALNHSIETDRFEKAWYGDSVFVKKCSAVVAALPNILAGTHKHVTDLAIRVAAQHLDNKLTFSPGTRVVNKDFPCSRGTVVCGKPRGFRERRSWNKGGLDWGHSEELLLIVMDGSRSWSQVKLSDWKEIRRPS